MKRFLTTFCAFMLAVIASAQTSYPAIVKVQYNFIHVRDTTHRDKPYTENMLLLVGKEGSYYTSFDRIEGDVNSYLNMKRGIQSFAPGKDLYYGYFYLFPKQRKSISYEATKALNYLVESETENLNWKILKDTLNFSGVHAQKATVTYKGRNWIAWFAPELPFASGPWKLYGLPGLIVEAYDDKKEVQFKFAGVENVKPGDLAVNSARDLDPSLIKRIGGLNASEIPMPTEKPINNGGPVKISKSEFDKLMAEMEKDPVGFLTAQYAAMGMRDPAEMAQRSASGTSGGGGSSGGNGAIQMQPNEKVPTPVKNPVNNPIELSRKN